MRADARLPLIYLPTVWHVGDLSRSRTVPHHHSALSYIGSALSVSVDPEDWTRVAKLGGFPTWSLSRHDAGWLDLQALDEEIVDEAVGWARDQGLIEIARRWRVRWHDDEVDDFLCSTSETEAEAAAEVESFDEDQDASMTEVVIPLLTPAGMARCGAAGQRRPVMNASDIAISFWAEDVIAPDWPDLVGVWQRDEFGEGDSPDEGGLFQSRLASMRIERVRNWPGQGEARAPASVLVDRTATCSAHVFVTSCVNGDGDEIAAMVDDPCSSAKFDLAEFARRLELPVAEAARLAGEMVAAQFGFSSPVPILDDRRVTYAAATYQGIPCVYFTHSAVEFVFQRRGLLACRDQVGMQPVVEAAAPGP